MNTYITKTINFIKKETVLSIAFLLAIISSFFVIPDKKYIDYIDWHTLLLLFALMAVMAGFQSMGVFKKIGNILLSNIKNTRQMLLILTFLPFIFSMIITNDVALITFVPFAIIVLRMSNQEKLLIPLIVLQTIAANLGSMLTPMGNPQNLYLYAKSEMSPISFIALMLPYTIIAGITLLLCILCIKNNKIEGLTLENIPLSNLPLTIGYLLLFLLCILSVANIISPVIVAMLCLIFLIIFDKKILKAIDYSLLGTFIGFFIFIGNMERIDSFCSFIEKILAGNEKLVAILSSQIISNVPAALLLSGFSNNWNALIIGTNLGGLGTLIASMASLISYKQLAAQYPEKRSRYLLVFTVANIFMLIILYLFDMIL